MRMWMVNPELLCNLHLIGEHGEFHKFKLAFEKGKSIKGRLSPLVQVEPLSMQKRHDELAAEITRRGMIHKSPYEMPSLDKYTAEEINAKVDVQHSLRDLCERCYDCRMRIEASGLLEPKK